MTNLTTQQKNRTLFLRTQLPNITMSLLINWTKTFGLSNMCIIYVTYPNLKEFRHVSKNFNNCLYLLDSQMGIDMILDGLVVLYLLDSLFWEACDNSCNKRVRYAARNDNNGNFSIIFYGRKFHFEFKYAEQDIKARYYWNIWSFYRQSSSLLHQIVSSFQWI